MTKFPKNAGEAYIARREEVQAQMQELQEAVNAHQPAFMGWCDVGDMCHVGEILGQALEFLEHVNGS